MVCPIALASILLEANIAPKSKSGRITGHGNLVDARAKCRTTGNPIAASQRIVLFVRSFFLSDFVMVWWFGCAFCERRRMAKLSEAGGPA